MQLSREGGAGSGADIPQSAEACPQVPQPGAARVEQPRRGLTQLTEASTQGTDMQTRSTFSVVALAAVMVMALTVSLASARRFGLSNQTFRAIWTLLRFEIEGTATIECPVTLEGSFHSRTLSKVSGQLVGYVTRAFVRGGLTECLNTGNVRANTETLPWHIQYNSFIGTLPSISEINFEIIGADVNVDPSSIFLPNCRIRSEQAHPAQILLIITGDVKIVRPDPVRKIPLPGVCEFGGEANLRGTGETFVQGSTTTRVAIRLVQ
jgi:hypothetical protein